MSILNFLGSIFGPAERIIDELNTSEQEKLELRNELAKIQMQVHAKTTELMVAEAKSDNWLTSSWRPICALSLFLLILLDGFNLVTAPDQVYNLAEIFLGVYSFSRGAEKISRNLKK